MSHIPASKMPHAKAHGEDIDGHAPQPDQAQPAPEPTTAVPPASASGTTPANDGPSATESAARASADEPHTRDDGDRSPFAIAAMVIGGLAVVGGLVAALLPVLAPTDRPKAKKRKKRKAA